MYSECAQYELETLTQVVETLDIEHEALMGSDAERLEQAVRQNGAPSRMLKQGTNEKNWGLKRASGTKLNHTLACLTAYVTEPLSCG